MAFYIRKSVKVGPVRFNLSKSGIGLSAGVKGLRFGTGPRGNYVHIGAGGLYYRQSLSSRPSVRSASDARSQTSENLPPPDSHGPMEEISSGCVSRMIDSNAAALLAELDLKQKRLRAFPIVLTASVALIAGLFLQRVSPWITTPLAVALLLATAFAYYWDLLKKSAVVLYDLDEDRISAFQRLHQSLEELSASGGLWHISARGDVHDAKYHAGASHLVRRKRVHLDDRSPPFLRTNVPSYCIPTGEQRFYFLPDTVLVYATNGVGAVSYDSLQLRYAPTRFIEEESVPHDARVVDRTWRYVNKKGGPDRRFKDNRELPVCEYEEAKLLSTTGVNEILQISRVGLAKNVESAVRNMAASLQRARSMPVAKAPIPARVESLVNRGRPQSPSLEATATVPPPLPQQSSPPVDFHDTLIRTLCCAMVVDGRASGVEKDRIINLIARTGATLDATEISQRISAFIEETTTYGFKNVLSKTLSMVSVFKKAGREDVLLRCLESLVSADGTVSDAERAFLARVRKILA